MKQIMIIILFTVTGLLSAEEVSLTAADGFQLKADYYAGKSGRPGVILLHQCNDDRSMYEALGRRLSVAGIHVLALDFRGYGDSVTADVDIMAVRNSSDQQTYMKYAEPIRRHWASDVEIAADFLRVRTGDSVPLGAGGASCGGGQSLILAEQREISALMLFSSGNSPEMIQRYQQLDPVPTLFIAAEEDESSYQGATQLFTLARHPQSRMILYKGNGHGKPLFDHDPSLIETITGWYRIQLVAE